MGIPLFDRTKQPERIEYAFILYWHTGMLDGFEPLVFLNDNKNNLLNVNSADKYVFSTMRDVFHLSEPMRRHYACRGEPCVLEIDLPKNTVLNLISSKDYATFLPHVVKAHAFVFSDAHVDVKFKNDKYEEVNLISTSAAMRRR